MTDKEAKEARKLHDKYVEEERKEENQLQQKEGIFPQFFHEIL